MHIAPLLLSIAMLPEMVVFTDGRFLKVTEYQHRNGSYTLHLVSGGTVVVPEERVEQIVRSKWKLALEDFYKKEVIRMNLFIVLGVPCCIATGRKPLILKGTSGQNGVRTKPQFDISFPLRKMSRFSVTEGI